MHEFSIACSIVENVLAFCQAEAPGRVIAVRVAIGELSCIETEQLGFCYSSITKGTAIEDSELEFEKIEAAVECSHCSYRGKPKYWDEALWSVAVPTLQCPACGQSVEAISGQDCEIRTVRFAKS